MKKIALLLGVVAAILLGCGGRKNTKTLGDVSILCENISRRLDTLKKDPTTLTALEKKEILEVLRRKLHRNDSELKDVSDEVLWASWLMRMGKQPVGPVEAPEKPVNSENSKKPEKPVEMIPETPKAGKRDSSQKTQKTWTLPPIYEMEEIVTDNKPTPREKVIAIMRESTNGLFAGQSDDEIWAFYKTYINKD